MTESRWIRAPRPETAEALEEAGYSPFFAELLARRGVHTADAARAYLQPSIENLHDPLELTGLERQMERLEQAIHSGETICLIGDYDVDGITASALLKAIFDAVGLTSVVVLPDRFRHGYGFHPSFVEDAAKAGCSLLLTVDCGSNSSESARLAQEAGLDVLVLDHHRPSDELPEGVLHVNPHFEAEDSPFRWLSGAGLAFELARALLDRAGQDIAPERLARVACLGTIADMVPLVAENRIIAASGLTALSSTPSPGLRSLFESARIEAPFTSQDVGFRIGPRINAAGRLADARIAFDLLLTRDLDEARRLAQRLESLNRERQAEEARVVEEARQIIEREGGKRQILVAWSPSWHPGVVGIAAGRLAREFHRPTILLVEQGEHATGSGRSIPHVDLHQLVEEVAADLVRFGGHGQAIGLTANSGELEALREHLEEAAASRMPEVPQPELEYEAEATAMSLTLDLLQELRQLAPFGQGNSEPLLRMNGLSPLAPPRSFGNGHIEIQARDASGAQFRAVGWRMAERHGGLNERFDALGYLEEDTYRGGVRVRLRDLRAADAD